MTEFEQQLLSKIAALESAIDALRSESSISKLTYFENLPPGAIVGAEYVAMKFNCSEEAVVRGRFDTDKIRRFRNKPLAWVKREVDAVLLQLTQPVAEKAMEIRNRTNKRKVKKT